MSYRHRDSSQTDLAESSVCIVLTPHPVHCTTIETDINILLPWAMGTVILYRFLLSKWKFLRLASFTQHGALGICVFVWQLMPLCC